MVGIFRSVFFVLVILLMMNPAVFGGNEADLDFILRCNPITPERAKETAVFTFNETNELKVALIGLIQAYQLFISSQDIDVCNFTPSCSRFAVTALKRHGPLHGILMISDRLQRCNKMGKQYYPINQETGKCDDPVERNFAGSK